MTKIIFREHDGKEQAVDVENGMTVMEAAIKNMIPGIDADCGGACACSTCHVYVDEDFAAALPPMSEDENDLLDSSDHRDETSRLSCQVEMTDALDGLKVTIAPED